MIELIKFLHVLMAINLIALTGYCVIKPTAIYLKKMNLSLLVGSIIAFVTGTLLVYPRHFTFHTHWIQAAYIFLSVFFLGIIGLIFLNKQSIHGRWNQFFYLIFFVILVIIMSDAVRKTAYG